MKVLKLVIFLVLLIFTLLNTMFMYIGAPLQTEMTAITMIGTILILGICGMLTLINASTNGRFTQKLTMRLQIVLLLFLVIFSLYSRIMEAIASDFGFFFFWRCFATVLYITLLLLTNSITRDIFKALVNIFENR